MAMVNTVYWLSTQTGLWLKLVGLVQTKVCGCIYHVNSRNGSATNSAL